MPSLSKKDAEEKLAAGVERAQPFDLPEIYSELFPDEPISAPLDACEIVKLIRNGLEPEEIVDLWNVVFPDDHHVWYDEEASEFRYNEEGS